MALLDKFESAAAIREQLSAGGHDPTRRPVIVGFAAETNDVREHARAKLDAKNIDLIVANDVAAPGVGFEHDTNQVRIMSRSGSEREVALQDKRAVARAVLDEVVAYRSAR